MQPRLELWLGPAWSRLPFAEAAKEVGPECLPATTPVCLCTITSWTWHSACGNMATCLRLHKALQFSLCPPAEPGHLSCCVCCRHVWISPAARMPAALPSCPQHPLWYTIDLAYFHGEQRMGDVFHYVYLYIWDLCVWTLVKKFVLSRKHQKWVKTVLHNSFRYIIFFDVLN